MSEYIDIYIDTTTKVQEDATEFDYELFERFISGGPWVAHSEYMKLKSENAKLRELLQRTWDAFHDATAREFVTVKNELRELGVEVDR